MRNVNEGRTKRDWRTAALWGVIGFLIGQIPQYHELYRKWFAEPITINVALAESGPAFIQRVYKSGDGHWKSIPARTYVFATIHNSGERTVSMNSYSVDVEVANRWYSLNAIPQAPEGVIPLQQSAFIGFRDDGLMLRDEEDKDLLELKLSSSGLAPGADISGWLFFSDSLPGKVSKVRFTFTDRDGREHRIRVDGNYGGSARPLEKIMLHYSAPEPIPSEMRPLVATSKTP